ncbi:MAG: Gfo/Idh/MocA family oxidoreductase [Pirellulales bacterium]|nr:Gfo/Idh/MocA family oxidoreductase [Pirellulales bacterium]
MSSEAEQFGSALIEPARKKCVRMAVVGLGHWGKNVLRSFATADGCDVRAICDDKPELLARYASLYPSARSTGSFQSVIDDPHTDAVAIVTPAPLHHEMVTRALSAGKHVFVEKPASLTVAHAQEMVELADRMHRKLMVGHLLEYHPAVAAMKEQIDGGHLGDVHYMYSQRLNLGIVRQSENAFWSLAPHDISVILYLFGSEPDEVSASGASFLQNGIEDVVFANLHFPDGRIAQIHVSWLDPHKARKMVVVGSKKMMVFDDMHPSEKIRIFDKGANVADDANSPLHSITVRHGDIHLPHIDGRPPLDIETAHFVDCILNDRRPRSDGHDGLHVVRVLEQVEQYLHRPKVTQVRMPAKMFVTPQPRAAVLQDMETLPQL